MHSSQGRGLRSLSAGTQHVLYAMTKCIYQQTDSSSSHIDLSAQVLGVSGGMSNEVSTADTRILKSIAENTFFRERHLSYSSGPVMGSQLKG